MEQQCIEELNSDDYMEFIFSEGAISRQRLDVLRDYCVVRINEKWSVISIHIGELREPTFEAIGYSSFPNIYGLVDLGAVSAAGISAIREQPVLGLLGTGTNIAVIDTGINWRHKAFLRNDGTTRIKVIWDQESNRIFTEADINNALAGENIDIPGDDNGHGTFMAGIAAGSIDRINGFSGAAPEAGLIIVKLRPARQFLRDFYFIKEGAPAYSEIDIMRGVEFVSRYVEAQQLLVSYCLGIGSTLGTHAGTSPLCDQLADEAEKVGHCVSIAVGNEGNERLHYSGFLTGDEPERVEIRVGEGERGFTCELWSAAPEVYSVELISPSGQIINRIPSRTDRTTRLNFLFEDTIAYVYYKQYESMSGQNILIIRFNRPAAGIWTLNIYGRELTTGSYDIWIMNREFLTAGTYFVRSDAYTTVTEPANVPQCIAVTAYDYRNNSIHIKAGRGFNVYDVIKPDFAAPGVDIIGPAEIGSESYVVRSGTSVAAAFYSGFAALIQEYGFVLGRIPYIRTSEIKNITLAGCIRKDGIPYPSREWGYGIVNLYNSLENLRRE